MQNVRTMIRRPVPIGTAAASGLLAFVAGAVIALAVPAVATGVSVMNNSSGTASASAVGAEQIDGAGERTAARADHGDLIHHQ